MRRSDWILVAFALLVALATKVAWCQEAEYAEGESAVVTAELRGGFLLCRWASHFAQIAGLEEGSKDRADLTRLVLEGGFCMEAEPGAEVVVYEGAAEALAPGIVEPDSAVMIILPEAEPVAGQTPGWWVSRAALEVKS